MPSEDTKILEFHQYRKYDKTPSIIYADLEFLIKRIDGCKSSSKKSSTAKAGEYIPCGYSMSVIWTFGGIKNNHYVCRGGECKTKFCKSLKVHTIKIINFENKKVIPLITEQQESYEKAKIWYICKK